MIIKKISNNPLVNADRRATVEAMLNPASIVLYVVTDYRDSNSNTIIDLPKKKYVFSTDGNMVDSTTWQPAQLVDVVVWQDEDNNPIMWKDRPSTAVSEFVFFNNLPANTFTDNTLWDRVKKLVEMRLTALDLQGKFN